MKNYAYAAAAGLIILVAIAAFVSPAGAWPLAATALGLIVLANLDRVSEVSASATGFNAKMREAEDRLADLKRMIAVSAEAQLSLIQQTGRWGGVDDDRKEYFLGETIEIMREAKLPQIQIEKIKSECWDRYVVIDYAHAILGNSTIPETSDQQIIERWKAMRRADADPDSIQKFLDDVGDDNAERRQMLLALRHYLGTGKHKDYALWKRRNTLPRISVRAPTFPQ